MIEDTIKRANENGFLRRINSRIKEKEKNIDYNKKKYWKLTASERLHYDSRVEKIQKINSIIPFQITGIIATVYFYVLVIFTLFKVLFQVNPVHMVNGFLTIIGTAPLLLGIALFFDLFFIFVGLVNKKKQMKYLNEKYGFKKV